MHFFTTQTVRYLEKQSMEMKPVDVKGRDAERNESTKLEERHFPGGIPYALSLASFAAEELSSVSNTWQSAGSILKNISQPLTGFAALKGKFYFAAHESGAMLEYKLATNKWKYKFRENMPRPGAALCAHKELIFTIGGQANSDDGAVGYTHYFKPGTDELKWVGEMKFPRVNFAAVSCGDSLYVIGGRFKTLKLDSIERFDLSTEKWETKGSMKVTRELFGAVAHGNDIFVIGGIGDIFRRRGRAVLSTGEIYNTETGDVTKMPSMDTARHSFGIFINEGKIYCVGGIATNFRRLRSTEVFDLATRTWKYGDNLDGIKGEVVCTTITC